MDLYISLRYQSTRRIAALRDDGKRVDESPWLAKIVCLDAIPCLSAIDRRTPEDRGMGPNDNQRLDIEALDVSAGFAIDHVTMSLEAL